jgi:hypothetical protein
VWANLIDTVVATSFIRYNNALLKKCYRSSMASLCFKTGNGGKIHAQFSAAISYRGSQIAPELFGKASKLDEGC